MATTTAAPKVFNNERLQNLIAEKLFDLGLPFFPVILRRATTYAALVLLDISKRDDDRLADDLSQLQVYLSGVAHSQNLNVEVCCEWDPPNGGPNSFTISVRRYDRSNMISEQTVTITAQ